jgi:hypothetical protein
MTTDLDEGEKNKQQHVLLLGFLDVLIVKDHS